MSQTLQDFISNLDETTSKLYLTYLDFKHELGESNEQTVQAKAVYEESNSNYEKAKLAKEQFTTLETLKIQVQAANQNAENKNSEALLAKQEYEAAKLVYDNTPNDDNKVIVDEKYATYEEKLNISVDAAAEAAQLSTQYRTDEQAAIDLAKEAGYIFPIQLPSDAEILSTLSQLINEGSMDVSEIQEKINDIVTTSTTFNLFIEKMSIYNDYETILETRLKQIYNFLKEDSVIDNQEIIITTLRYEIVKAVNNYKEQVLKNNSLAVAVNTMYEDIQDRLSTLHIISNEVSTTMSDIEKIIEIKRGGDSFAKKILFFPMVNGVYTTNVIIPVNTSKLMLISENIYKLRYEFVYNNNTKKIIYKGASTINIKLKIEVLSSDLSMYDTSTKFLAVFTKGALTRTYEFSCNKNIIDNQINMHSQNFFIGTNEEIQIKLADTTPKIPLEIHDAIISIILL